MDQPTPAPGSGQDVREAAAAAIAPDPLTADLLAKHSAGEKLSPAEYGRLGAWKAKLKTMFGGGKSGAVPGSAQPGLGTGQPASVAALVPDPAPADGLAPVPADPRLVQRTTETILKTCDGIARRYVVSEARKAGADDKTAARFESAAALPAGAREMMVETSPDVAAAMGISPETMPIATFLGGLGLWATNLWLAVDELRRLQAQREKREAPRPAPDTAREASGDAPSRQ